MRVDLNNVEMHLTNFHSAAGYEFMWKYLLESGHASVDSEVDSDIEAFLAFCLQNSSKSKAQILQDLYVLFRLPKVGGYFVEFGAADGLTMSNTWLLENQMGWTGVLAEPSPNWHADLQANRKCNLDLRCVWTKTGEVLNFRATENAWLATIDSFSDGDGHAGLRAVNSKVLPVKTVSLNDLLLENHAPRYFDFLSVDTEGSEFPILDSLDFDQWKPRIICVEHNLVDAQRVKIKNLLDGQGYVREFEILTGCDDWYRHPELLAQK
jgi:FkbM family methyltransferase